MSDRIDVGVAGATGMVGVELVRLLHEHPWFRLTEVGASERSVGRTLGDTLPQGEPALPHAAAGLVLKDPGDAWSAPVILSALPASVAGETETRLAEEGHLVVSNASAHRMRPDVPLVIPEVNAAHLELLERQPWAGGLVTNPNCVVAGLALALAPLHRTFGLERVLVTTFQAISGAGRPGPAAGDLVDNVIPLIPGEEAKVAREPLKILGAPSEPAAFPISATCARVPVLHGHLLAVSVELSRRAGAEEVAGAIRGFESAVADLGLPSAPVCPLVVTEEEARPQPRLDRNREGGMTVTVGRVRPCDVLHVKFLVLAHNLARGAAGAALLNAELCHVSGVRSASSPVGGAA